MALKRPTYTQPLGQSWPFAVLMPQRVGRSRGWRRTLLGVNLAGAAHGADLGGSSKYSREALEDRCGEGFRVNSR
jgi:hypothetical protein